MSREEVSHAVEEILSSVDKSSSIEKLGSTHVGVGTTNIDTPSSVGNVVKSAPLRKSSEVPTKLYVGNLSMNLNSKDLRGMFQKYGTISDVDVVGNFAFVVMPHEAEAEDAIRALHEKSVDGKKLIVEKKKAKPSAGGRGGKPGFDRNRGRDVQIFVAKCKDVPDEKLKEIFGKFGSVSDVQRPRTKPDIAFVCMVNFFEARKAIEGLHRKKIDGLSQILLVQLATNNLTKDGRPLNMLLQRGETIKLFVGNLAKDTDSKALGALFEKYGPVYDAAVMKDKDFGFVHMLSRESAEDAVRSLNRRDFKGANISVTFSTKKGMLIARQGPDMGPNVNANISDLRGRLGSKSMAPRMPMGRGMGDPMGRGMGDPMGRGMGDPMGRGMGDSMRPLPDMFPDQGVDQLLNLQQQINSRLAQLAPNLASHFDPLFKPDRFRPSRPEEDFAGSRPYGAGRSPERRGNDMRLLNDDRSRYGNFMGGNLSPLKRGRSPMRSMHRLSPSPKRPFLDQRMGLPSPRRNDFRKIDDMQLPTPGEASMALRNSAKSVPPKVMRSRVF